MTSGVSDVRVEFDWPDRPSPDRRDDVLRAAGHQGLIGAKDKTIGGRVPSALVEAAKATDRHSVGFGIAAVRFVQGRAGGRLRASAAGPQRQRAEGRRAGCLTSGAHCAGSSRIGSLSPSGAGRGRDLPYVRGGRPAPGAELLLDTCVYIDVLQGSTPPEVDALLTRRTLNHLAVCVAELTHGLGRLDPRHPGTEDVSRSIAGVVTSIPLTGSQTATADVVIEAGILAGLVFRLCGLASGQEIAALNDAIIYLHAMTNGLTVLTRNVREFRRDEPDPAGTAGLVL